MASTKFHAAMVVHHLRNARAELKRLELLDDSLSGGMHDSVVDVLSEAEEYRKSLKP